jgi:hypothetical protein
MQSLRRSILPRDEVHRNEMAGILAPSANPEILMAPELCSIGASPKAKFRLHDRAGHLLQTVASEASVDWPNASRCVVIFLKRVTLKFHVWIAGCHRSQCYYSLLVVKIAGCFVISANSRTFSSFSPLPLSECDRTFRINYPFAENCPCQPGKTNQ